MRQHQRESRCRRRSIPVEGVPGTDMRQVAMFASRIRAGIVFILLDSLCVIAGYGLAEVAYFRDRAPAHYWQHFLEFLLVAIVVTIVCNRLFGLYGRMWRHAGADEARQLMLSTAVSLCVLIAFWPAGRRLRIELVPPIVVVVGCVFSAGGMGILRFHSRLFAWQRGSKRLGSAGGRDRQSRHRCGRHSRDAPEPGGGPGPRSRLRR